MANAQAIEAGEAFVRITAEDHRFQATLKGLNDKLREWGRDIALAGASIFGGFVAAFKMSDFADEIAKMSARTGIAIETLSAWRYAAQRTGTDIEAVQGAYARLSRVLQGATDDGGSAQQAFATLGLSVASLLNLSPEERFTTVSQAIAALPDPTQRAALAMQIFGRNSMQLLPLLTQLDELTRQAKAKGFVLSPEQARQYEAVKDAWTEMRFALQGMALELSRAILPTIRDFADWVIQAGKSVSQWITKNQELLQTLLKGAGVLLLVGGGMAVFSKTIAFVSSTLAALSGVITSVTAGLAALRAAAAAHPILAIATAIATVGGAVILSSAEGTGVSRTANELSAVQQQKQALADAQAEAAKYTERLEQLSKQHQLTNAEQAEALRLIAELTKRYGDLGIVLDRTTGQLIGVEQALERINAQNRQQSLAVLEKELALLQERNQAIQSELAYRGEGGYSRYRDIISGISKLFPEAWVGLERYTREELQQMGVDLEKRMQAITAQMERLYRGETATLGQGKLGQEGGWLGIAEPEEVLKAEKRIRDARIALIEDEIQRARAAQMAWFQEQQRQYQGNAVMLEKIQQEHALRMEKIEQDSQRRLQAARLQADLAQINLIENHWERERAALARQYQEKMKAAQGDAALQAEIQREYQAQTARLETERRKEIEERRKSIQEQIQDVKIDLQFEGADRQIAKLQAQFQQELQKLLKEGASAEDIAALRELYQLRIALVQKEAAAKQPAPEPPRWSVAGTFNPFGISGLGVGAGVFERTAAAAEETAKNTRRLAQRAQGGLVFT